MDKRSWPWKKKSSDKLAAEKANVSGSDSCATDSDGKLDNNNKQPKYVQISIESYTHLTGLENRVKSYEDQVHNLEDEIKELNEKLSEAHLEMINKENLVKQHAKVAEEAVSGWEKADAEAAALKNNVESVTLLKLTAEDRAAHLDSALKEHMRQIRNLKEDHELKYQEVILSKNKIFDKMKHELETRIAKFEQQLLRSAADNAALSRTLQERSNMLFQLSEDKSQAQAEIERLRSNIESCEKEVNSLKYEVHIAKKEVEIRNEEKNMSMRSADVANKQHLEGVKKIAKLEAECQRLRGLVRKKLPGPAALAQMKLEVENMGRDYGESRVRRSTARSPTANLSQLPDFTLDNLLKCQKENELLAERLLSMDEETKMLKEALTKRNGELQSCRSIYAQTASKLQSLESHLQANGEWRSPVTHGSVSVEGFSSRKASNPPSFASVSECGNDDNVSYAGSCATLSMSDLSSVQKDKNTDTPRKSENTKNLDLMDDFLEMEKLAYQSHGSHETVSSPDVSGDTGSTCPEQAKLVGSPSKDGLASEYQVLSKVDSAVADPQLQADQPFFAKLKAELSRVIESMSEGNDMEKVIVDIRHIMQDVFDTSKHQLQNDVDAVPDFGTESIADGAQITSTNGTTLSGNVNSIDNVQFNQELKIAISDIHSFIMILGKEAKVVPGASPDGEGLSESLNKFSARYTESESGINLFDFVLDISYVLREASKLHFNVLGIKSSEVETSSSDCIDKIALPENKGVVDSSGEMYRNGCSHFSDSVSDPDTPSAGNLVPTSESAASRKCSPEEFDELKMDKDNLAVELARCMEKYESTKIQLLETEQQLADAKSQLTSVQKGNSLAETQLKCMTESYKSLETRAEGLQTEVKLLEGKIGNLDLELQEERRSHQNALNRCNDLLDQLQRIETHGVAGNDEKSSQEKDLAAAAEKLAECQETIYLLGKQLKALHPQSDSLSFPTRSRSQKMEASIEGEPITNDIVFPDHNAYGMDNARLFYLNRAGSESPSDIFEAEFSPSDSEANNPQRSPAGPNHQKHRPTKSSSSSASSTPTPLQMV
ncbi:filament-like plant protein 4 [Salvia hispanica]|uniref:filament-like plant protein 4 n=1 Tax=Salvia hispanica TaxID=49212 RepID=UPI002009B794|nr:filament-like plant protein 4 [Salvia hispanica]